jgi:adiponectin receptor
MLASNHIGYNSMESDDMASTVRRTGCPSVSRRRVHTASYRDAVFSIARAHTETINIWSHLFAAVWFVTRAAEFAVAMMSLFSPTTAAVLALLVANAFCFACSTLYHVFADHPSADAWLRFDHIGIVCAIWGSSVSLVVLSSGSHSFERSGHVLLVTAAATICCTCLSTGSLHGSSKRRLRIRTYVIMGSVAAVPALRCWYLHEPGQDLGLLAHFAIMVVVNGSGGAIYATDLLDKTIEERLGVPGASHQAMHVLAVFGALIYERGLMRVYFQYGALGEGRALQK